MQPAEALVHLHPVVPFFAPATRQNVYHMNLRNESFNEVRIPGLGGGNSCGSL